MPDSNICPECGAVVPGDAERCSLCGTPVSEGAAPPPGTSAEEEETVDTGAEAPPPSAAPAAGGNAAASAGGVFCNACGWENPSGANFCSRCGRELQAAASGATPREAGATPPGTKPAAGPPVAAPGSEEEGETATEDGEATLPSAADDGMMRRVALVVGVAALLVAGLYGWSAWSGSAGADAGAEGAAAPGEAPAVAGGGSGAATAPGSRGGAPRGSGAGASESSGGGGVPGIIRQQQGGDVPAAIAGRADSLQNVIDTQSGRHERLARRQLASLFAEAGLVPRAAAQQWQLAQASGSPSAWERAGSLLYDWMASLERGQTRAQVARLTADAYERVLESDPDNYDVRTNLAVAYLDTNNPMRGISEIKRVLDEAPDHVGARFNYGLMQMMIGRNATAIEQLERVREVAGEDSPYYQQAGQVIESIKEQTGGNPQDAPTPGSGGEGSSSGDGNGPSGAGGS